MTDKDPKGFPFADRNQLDLEIGQLITEEGTTLHKAGKKEPITMDKGGSIATITKDTWGTTNGYVVQEKPRGNAFGDNSSIQSVEYHASTYRANDSLVDKSVFDNSGYAALRTAEMGLFGVKKTTSLIGNSQGDVLLVTKVGDQESIKNITNSAAQAGITAASIRAAQIKFTPEGIDRDEQQQIINLIEKAGKLKPDPSGFRR